MSLVKATHRNVLKKQKNKNYNKQFAKTQFIEAI